MMAKLFEPCGDRVFIERLKPRTKVGSLYVAEIAKENPSIGKVLEVGGGVKDSAIRKGVAVIFGKYDGKEVPGMDKKYLMLREDNIEAIVMDAKFLKDYE
jgi:co-chaperonin GroES (HSP10)